MTNSFDARSEEILSEYTSGLARSGLARRPGRPDRDDVVTGGPEEKEGFTITDQDWEDEEFRKEVADIAANEGDPVALAKAKQNKLKRDQDALEQELRNLGTV